VHGASRSSVRADVPGVVLGAGEHCGGHKSPGEAPPRAGMGGTRLLMESPEKCY